MNETPTPGSEFRPYVAAAVTMRELTVRAVIIGSVLGVVFAASSVYLGLKVGLTVSASIPIAVLSITLFKWMTKAFGMQGGTILENNIVQTTGSAGESIAAGVAFTLPALLLMGFDMELGRILLVAILGGLIGVLMMIPLRHGLTVKEHGKLTFPEGTACADVLIVGERGGTSATTVFLGFFTGFGYAVLNLVFKLWSDTATFSLTFWDRLKGAMLGFEVSPPMLGVGYIIGLRTASNMMAGGCLAFLVLVPLIHHFGDGMTSAMYPATKTIAQMTPGDVRNNFILYIGAGAVATGGFIALARALPSIGGAFKRGLGSMRGGGAAGGAAVARTERDLPMSVVLGGSLALAVAIALAPILGINALSAVLIILFGFFFVTVSSRITGEIGSSSNPISGMTVATLLITCGLFVAIGWTGTDYKALALTTAALVCVAASNGGTIAQDLKTGFLVGGTPRAQQIAILCGVITSALVIGWTLQLLNETSTTFRPVAGEALTSAAPSGQRLAGPDGLDHEVVYLREDAGDLTRGKYLVDETRHPLFFVDPGVCGTYPYVAVAAAAGAAPLTIPAGAAVELGPDRKEYRLVPTDTGRFLARPDGTAVWLLEPRAKFDAPKAQLFRLIIDGTLGGRLPVALVLIGMMLAILVELMGIASLPFAVGLYLPIFTSAAIFVGGVVRWLVDRKRGTASAAGSEFSPGTLMASGLIAGGAIAGIFASVLAVTHPHLGGSIFDNAGWWPMTPFLLMAALLWWVGTRKKAAV